MRDMAKVCSSVKSLSKAGTLSNPICWQALQRRSPATISNKSSSNYEVKDIRFDSVVIVKTESGLGSGFFISNDEILTNYHVVENSSTISVTDKFGKILYINKRNMLKTKNE